MKAGGSRDRAVDHQDALEAVIFGPLTDRPADEFARALECLIGGPGHEPGKALAVRRDQLVERFGVALGHRPDLDAWPHADHHRGAQLPSLEKCW